MTDQQGRYVCYGTVAKEHDDDNADITAADQRPPEEVVYSTDDREEALAIKRNGGFVGESGWTVASRVVDTQATPPEQQGPETGKKPLSKEDFS